MKKVIKYIVFPSIVALSINAYAENGVMNCPEKLYCVVNNNNSCAVLPAPFSNWTILLSWMNNPPTPGTTITLGRGVISATPNNPNPQGGINFCSYLAPGYTGSNMAPPGNLSMYPVLTGKNDWKKGNWPGGSSYDCGSHWTKKGNTCPFVLK